MSKTFALVDCNNFYASCEKLFRPDLKNTPIVVLSNNDGCVVARSREAKEIGIKMGVPLFQIQDQLTYYGVQVFSSNYALYADISNRVMSVLEMLAPRVEVYSIDESFLDLTGVSNAMSLVDFGKQVRQTVVQWTGITVCVGIAPTKTLAKLANHAAKIYPATGGVVDLTSRDRQRKLLSITPIEEVWGVGRKLTKQLQMMGIKTALQLANANPKLIRKQFSVVLERTIHELNGESCLELDDVSPTKKQIVCSRSFGQRIKQFQHIREAICNYAVRAAEKLRLEKQYAQSVTVFLRTNPFSKTEPYYSNSATARMPIPTDDSRDIILYAIRMLRGIWKPGYRYMKAGIMLADFFEPGIYQMSLFDEISSRTDSKELMTVIDKINHSGKGNIWFAGQGVKQEWAMKRGNLSPAYTTRWDDLPVVI
ncbi:translesion error-prone DNA polymerase V subunit UmuC [Tolumonas lignilytica]|uniref:translesion error-prone DNA polymerase V subunit UmuC n=1 Tax=Tolumonas lignilytica TaxID=1283284 RepID=UPI0004676D13|nr:translesion error-prone DNA polymerase V subunit UmuC [Tolumonas lignilytica]